MENNIQPIFKPIQGGGKPVAIVKPEADTSDDSDKICPSANLPAVDALSFRQNPFMSRTSERTRCELFGRAKVILAY